MPTEFVLRYEKEEELYRNKTLDEKAEIIPEMVMYALEHGNKPAARKYFTYPSTVRSWVRKYQKYGLEGLKPKR